MIGAAIDCVHTIRHESAMKGSSFAVACSSMPDKPGHLDMWWCVVKGLLVVLQLVVVTPSLSWLAGWWVSSGCWFYAASTMLLAELSG